MLWKQKASGTISGIAKSEKLWNPKEPMPVRANKSNGQMMDSPTKCFPAARSELLDWGGLCRGGLLDYCLPIVCSGQHFATIETIEAVWGGEQQDWALRLWKSGPRIISTYIKLLSPLLWQMQYNYVWTTQNKNKNILLVLLFANLKLCLSNPNKPIMALSNDCAPQKSQNIKIKWSFFFGKEKVILLLIPQSLVLP